MTRETRPSRKNAGNTRGRPFQPGNPGKPKGARHKLTLIAERLMEDDAEAVVASVLAAAKSGDMTAARLVLERIVPIRKGRPVAFDLPAIETPADVVKAVGTLVSEVARGELTPEEAATVAGLLEMYRRTIETCEIEQRLSELEREASERK